MNINVKIKFLSPRAQCPEYATEGAAGMDLCADIDQPYVLKGRRQSIIPTGISLQIPKQYGGFIFARSGLASKHGITMANGVGVIDSDYTGEIKCALINSSEKDYVIHPGDRIAQIVFMPIATAVFTTEQFDQTKRGDSGFGSTGN